MGGENVIEFHKLPEAEPAARVNELCYPGVF
jgi:hypothetical protein